MSSVDVTLLAPAQPKRFSAGAWLLFNLRVGGLTFGMGSITPIFERALVQDTQSLTAEEFQETLTLAQVLPGPSLVSMAMYLGQRQFGTTFALLGVVCLCLPGALWAALVVHWVPFERPLVQTFMHGFAVGAVVLLADFMRRLWPGVRGTHLPGVRATPSKLARRLAVAFAVSGLIAARVPMFTVVGGGVLACLGAEFLP
ncbi:MAG TPA: chromate transporter [Polyangiaceae bacterium]